MRFKTVLDEMRQQDVVGSLRQLGDELKKENGLSIAQCEFWSDTLDRWAEDLVDPAGSGTCNAKSKSSLPPALVLEALQILEGEVNLREETRGRPSRRAQRRWPRITSVQAEQAFRDAEGAGRPGRQARRRRFAKLPDGESEFGYEIGLLAQGFRR